MKSTEFITEIGWCDMSGKTILSKEQITSAIKVGTIDNETVTALNSPDVTMYLLFDGQAYIIIGNSANSSGYYRLHRVWNETSKGAITALLIFVIGKLGKKLVIDSEEDLTKMGINWLAKLIAAGGRGISIVDQDNQPIDINALKSEWGASYSTEVSGPTAIFFENRCIKQQALSEHAANNLVMPYVYYLSDERLL